MFGTGLMEVAIGLIFIYLILSLACTVLSEWIAGLTGMRASNLEAGIRSLFSNGTIDTTKTGPDGKTTETDVKKDADGNVISSKTDDPNAKWLSVWDLHQAFQKDRGAEFQAKADAEINQQFANPL